MTHPQLENWQIIEPTSVDHVQFDGNVYNHPKIRDGYHHRTWTIIEMSLEEIVSLKEGDSIKTEQTTYLLGKQKEIDETEPDQWNTLQSGCPWFRFPNCKESCCVDKCKATGLVCSKDNCAPYHFITKMEELK